jgi:DNA-binding MarR family transcriptional regulator
MADNPQHAPPYDNIRNLLYQLAHVIDERLLQYRRGTRYEHVWQSDIRVFVQASRRKMSLSEIARELKVTRQAVQASVKRLRALEVVDLEPIPGNRRDKCVAITPRGLAAQAETVRQVAQIEAEIAVALGNMDIEKFRAALRAVLNGMNSAVNEFDRQPELAVTQPE